MKSMKKMSRYLALIVLSIWIESIVAAKVELYRSTKFQDLVHETDSIGNCTNLPNQPNGLRLGSVKTDSCIYLYPGPDCTMGNRRVLPGGERHFGVDIYPDFVVSSFEGCNDHVGPPLDVDIYGRERTEGPVLLRIRNLTGCLNLPSSLIGRTLSAANHNRKFYVWGQKNCHCPEKTIPVGRNNGSDNLNGDLEKYWLQPVDLDMLVSMHQEMYVQSIST